MSNLRRGFFDPNLSTIQELSDSSCATLGNVSPTKSIDSVDLAQTRRSILSNFNFRNNVNADEDSTIIEEDSSFFDENNAIVGAAKPRLDDEADKSEPPFQKSTKFDQVQCQQKENCRDIDKVAKKDDLSTKPPSKGGPTKRAFLKRGKI